MAKDKDKDKDKKKKGAVKMETETAELTQTDLTQGSFLESLNIDLAHEFAAVILYRTYASQVQGQSRLELRQFFEQEIPDELGHAQILADKIVALGGNPTTVPAPVKPAKDAVEMLRNALADEIDTIDRYVKR